MTNANDVALIAALGVDAVVTPHRRTPTVVEPRNSWTSPRPTSASTR